MLSDRCLNKQGLSPKVMFEKKHDIGYMRCIFLILFHHNWDQSLIKFYLYSTIPFYRRSFSMRLFGMRVSGFVIISSNFVSSIHRSLVAVEVEVVPTSSANGTLSHSAWSLHLLWKPCNHGDENFTAAERPSDVIDRNFPVQLVNMCDDDFITQKILLFSVS